jgi:hypothetical protein
MSNYKITFEDLKTIFEYIQKGYDDKFIEYLNSFEGDNIHDKFKNILNIWNNDVSYTLNFNINDTPTKIQLSYIISKLEEDFPNSSICGDNIKAIIGIPDRFELDDSRIPIYNIIKYIEISNISIDLTNLEFSEKQLLINKLPANVYNFMVDNIVNDHSKILEFDNNVLQDFKLNFMSSDIFSFLRGLFAGYADIYFKDVIYVLSKRIDGEVIYKSTPLEIEYYIERYSKDMEAQK